MPIRDPQSATHPSAPFNPWPWAVNGANALAEALAQHIPSMGKAPESNLRLASELGLGTMAAPGALPRLEHGVLSIFAGAAPDAVKRAEFLERMGVPKEKIWQTTGAARAPWDRKWREELSDHNAYIKGDWPNYGPTANNDFTPRQVGKLSDFLGHKELYDRYPDLKFTSTSIARRPGVMGVGSEAGEYTPTRGISVSAITEPRATEIALHELQHAIQNKEGFTTGGNPQGLQVELAVALAKQQLAKASPETLVALEKLKKLDPMELYRSLPGEAEARLVESRRTLTPDQRKEQFPYDPGYFQQQTGVALDGPLAELQKNMRGQGEQTIPEVMNSIRIKPDPQNVEEGFKLLRLDPRNPGKVFPLFVNAKQEIPFNVWDDAEMGGGYSFQGPNGHWYVPAKTGSNIAIPNDEVRQALLERGYIQSPDTKAIKVVARRPGYHAGDNPMSTHLGVKTPGSKVVNARGPLDVWSRGELPADVDWQSLVNSRAERYKTTNKKTGAIKGEINPATAHLTDQLPEDGYYRYKTNPNMTGNWLVGGSFKLDKLLSDEEVHAINSARGVADLPRMEPLDLSKFGFGDNGLPNEDLVQALLYAANKKSRR